MAARNLRSPFAHLVAFLAIFLLARPAAAQPSVALDDLDGAPVAGPGVEFLFAAGARFGSGWAVPLQAGETVEFNVIGAGENQSWSVEGKEGGTLEWSEKVKWSLPGGALTRRASGVFVARLPAVPGNHPLKLSFAREMKAGSAALPDRFDATLTFLVQAPFDRNGNGAIDGYPIGVYPNELGTDVPNAVASHPELYAPPASFIFVTPEAEPLRLSSHYRLADFIPRAEAGRPHWIALSPRLLEFLESATEELQAAYGKPRAACPLRPLAGFLSPNHLARLRAKGVNFAQFTRYQYGDAATVVWDGDGDGRMDDLDRDGKIDIADAEALAEKLAELQKRLGKFGGIGAAGNSKLPGVASTPVVDLDMRGVASRW